MHFEYNKMNEDCYNTRASIWDRFPYPDSLPLFLKKYYDPRLGSKVLDIGSGTGVLAKWLANQGFQVLCLDPSQEMIKRCKEKGLKTVQTTLQDYQPEEKFGMIFAILSLIHVPKAELPAQLQKLSQALSEGGLLFLGMLEGSGEGVFEQPFPRFFAYYIPQEIEALLHPYFIRLDYVNHQGYMLWVLKSCPKGPFCAEGERPHREP